MEQQIIEDIRVKLKSDIELTIPQAHFTIPKDTDMETVAKQLVDSLSIFMILLDKQNPIASEAQPDKHIMLASEYKGIHNLIKQEK